MSTPHPASSKTNDSAEQLRELHDFLGEQKAKLRAIRQSSPDDLDIRLSRAYGTMHATCTWIASCVDTFGSIEAIPENIKDSILGFLAKRMGGIQ